MDLQERMRLGAVVKYACTLGVFALAAALTDYIRPAAGPTPLILFITAGTLLAWMSGTTHALACTALSLPVIIRGTPNLDEPRDAMVAAVRLVTYLSCIALVCGMSARRRRAEQELARAGRVTILGQFAASIAHEISQPLSAAGCSAAVCVRWLEADPPDVARAADAARDAVRDSERAANLVDRISGLVRGRAASREPLDLRELVDEVLALVKTAHGPHGERMEVVAPPGEPLMIEGDRLQLQQVLLNLLANARHAVAEAPPPCRIEIALKPGLDTHVIEVRDSGPGMRPDCIARAFDPFYTTKPEGLGMGLTLSRTIVEAHGGRLWGESRAGAGATFVISLPAARPRARERERS